MPLRSRVVQFTEAFIADAMALMPELAAFRDTLERSRRGVLFGAETAGARRADARASWCGAQGIRRIELFWGVIGALEPRRGTSRS